MKVFFLQCWPKTGWFSFTLVWHIEDIIAKGSFSIFMRDTFFYIFITVIKGFANNVYY